MYLKLLLKSFNRIAETIPEFCPDCKKSVKTRIEKKSAMTIAVKFQHSIKIHLE